MPPELCLRGVIPNQLAKCRASLKCVTSPEVPALHVEASVAFYQGLGLRLIVSAIPRYARFECPDGDSTFSLHQVHQPPAGPGAIIYFECDSLDDKVRAFEGLGDRFTQNPKDEPRLWREARLVDPSGNVVCLYAAGENRRNPPRRVAP